MPLLERFLPARWRKKDDPPAPPIINDGDRNLPSIRILRGPYQVEGAGGGYGGWGLGFSSLTFQTQARDGYSRNSDVYACVSLIAEAASQVKWWDDTPGTKAITPRELLYVAMRKSLTALHSSVDKVSTAKDYAAAYQRNLQKATDPKASVALLMHAGGSSFINAWVSSLLISGDVYVELEMDGNTVKQLHILRPDCVQYVLNKTGYYEDEESSLDYWKVSAFGRTPRRVDKQFMMHSKLFNPLHPIDGMAPLDAAMVNVLLQNEGVESVRRSLQRGAVDGWIELAKDSEWSDEQLIALRQKIRAAKMEGEELTLQYAQWHERGIKPNESSYADTQSLSKRDIASVYHVDPVLIGDMQGRTYATYRESRRGLYMEAVIPALTLLKDDWNRVIGPKLNSPLTFDKDSLDAITAAREEATDRVVKLWQTGLIDRTESRSDLLYDPVPGDDGVFYAPASFVPMAEPGAEPPPAPGPTE
jgi:HK97 family phage portal protein